MKMNIRTATLQDIDQIAAVEKECFPAAEAATKEEFEQRLSHYADHFWLMFEEEKLIAFVDGMVTNQEDLTDEMYEKAEMHDEKGDTYIEQIDTLIGNKDKLSKALWEINPKNTSCLLYTSPSPRDTR